MGIFLCDAIGPHGTTEFADRILAGKLTSEDERDIKFQEAFELMKCMKSQDLHPKKRKPEQWITDSIQALISKEATYTPVLQEDLPAEEDEVLLKEEDILIFLEIIAEDYEEGFREWPEMTATSPSGRHLGMYKVLLGIENL